MATEVETLIVTLEATTKQYERALAKAQQTTVSQMRAIERTVDEGGRRAERKMGEHGREMANALAKGFGLGRVGHAGIGVFLVDEFAKSARELVQVAADAGDKSAQKFLDEWDQMLKKLKGLLGSSIGAALHDIMESTITDIDNIIKAWNMIPGHAAVPTFRQAGGPRDNAIMNDLQSRIAAKQAELDANVQAGFGDTVEANALRAELVGLRKELNKLSIAIEHGVGGRVGITSPIFGGLGGSLGGDDAVKGFVQRVIKAEGYGKNPLSNAEGVGQFIPSTWIDQFRKTFPELAKAMSREQILSLRNQGRYAEPVIENYAKENAEALKAAGVAVTEANLHIAHFLGVGDAIKVLRSAPGTPLQGLINGPSIQANPGLLGGGATVQDVLNYGARRAEMATIGPGAVNKGALQAPGEDELKRSREMIENLKDERDALSQTALQQEINNNLKKAGVNAESEYGKQIVAETTQLFNAKKAQEDHAKAVEEAAKRQQAAQQAMAEQMKVVGDELESATSGFIDALIDGKDASEALRDALRSLGKDIVHMALKSIFSSIFNPTAAAGGAAGGGGIFGGLLGFAGGGQFKVGGSGGTDSQLVAFRATPGEQVSISNRRLSGRHGGGGLSMGGTIINIAGNADERTLAIMERRIAQNNYAQRKALERDWGAMGVRYNQLRG